YAWSCIPRLVRSIVVPLAPRLGTLGGVYFPCLQSILGVTLFLRMPWVTSQGGVFLTCILFVLCQSVAYLTTLSICALVTNGAPPRPSSFSLGCVVIHRRYDVFVAMVLGLLGSSTGNLDYLSPFLTMVSLMQCLTLNLACFAASAAHTPGFRPQWYAWAAVAMMMGTSLSLVCRRYFHWTTALVGAMWCFGLMMFFSWLRALGAIAICIALRIYVKYLGVEQDWGNSVRGMQLELVHTSNVTGANEPSQEHTKNWRPQVLVFCKMDSTGLPLSPQILHFASQLKEGHVRPPLCRCVHRSSEIVLSQGLVEVVGLVPRNDDKSYDECQAATVVLRQHLATARLSAFGHVYACKDPLETMAMVAEASGMGCLRTNTVMVGWPNTWESGDAAPYVDMLHDMINCKKSVMVLKNMETLPFNDAKKNGYMDVWWVLHDGGLLLLVATLSFSVRNPSQYSQLTDELNDIGSFVEDGDDDEAPTVLSPRKSKPPLPKGYVSVDPRMRHAQRFNRQLQASLVVMNLPRLIGIPPLDCTWFQSLILYSIDALFHVVMHYVEALTENLSSVVLIRGSGREVFSTSEPAYSFVKARRAYLAEVADLRKLYLQQENARREKLARDQATERERVLKAKAARLEMKRQLQAIRAKEVEAEKAEHAEFVAKRFQERKIVREQHEAAVEAKREAVLGQLTEQSKNWILPDTIDDQLTEAAFATQLKEATKSKVGNLGALSWLERLKTMKPVDYEDVDDDGKK
ncbi:hypothetical protein DYB32_005375, partial [Aphanomyces invadans]